VGGQGAGGARRGRGGGEEGRGGRRSHGVENSFYIDEYERMRIYIAADFLYYYAVGRITGFSFDCLIIIGFTLLVDSHSMMTC
jgi:hypothetical protein